MDEKRPKQTEDVAPCDLREGLTDRAGSPGDEDSAQNSPWEARFVQSGRFIDTPEILGHPREVRKAGMATVCLSDPDAGNDQQRECNWAMGHRVTHLELPTETPSARGRGGQEALVVQKKGECNRKAPRKMPPKSQSG